MTIIMAMTMITVVMTKIIRMIVVMEFVYCRNKATTKSAPSDHPVGILLDASAVGWYD